MRERQWRRVVRKHLQKSPGGSLQRKILCKVESFLTRRIEAKTAKLVSKRLTLGDYAEGLDKKNPPSSGYVNQDGYDDFAYAPKGRVVEREVLLETEDLAVYREKIVD